MGALFGDVTESVERDQVPANFLVRVLLHLGHRVGEEALRERVTVFDLGPQPGEQPPGFLGSPAFTQGDSLPYPLEQGLVVLGPVGVLLGRDDVVEADGVDGEALAVDDGLASGQLLVGDEVAIGGEQSGEYIEAAGVGHPGGDVGAGEHGRVERNRQGPGFLVAHALDPETGVGLSHGGGAVGHGRGAPRLSGRRP